MISGQIAMNEGSVLTLPRHGGRKNKRINEQKGRRMKAMDDDGIVSGNHWLKISGDIDFRPQTPLLGTNRLCI
jgi:hypothetical protein